MEEKGTMIIEEFTKRSIISNAAFPSSAHSGYRYLNRSINPVKKKTINYIRLTQIHSTT